MADSGTISVIFDWTVLEATARSLRDGVSIASSAAGKLIASVSTHKTQRQIPESRRGLWEGLERAEALRLEYIEGGWTSGALRRERQAQVGDVLIAISGGEGVEHLAQLYASEGKPVIALDIDVGSSTRDGHGGAARLHAEALAHPEEFFRLVDPSGGSALLAQTATGPGSVQPDRVVAAVIRLLEGLQDPEAFYVRLLNPKVPGHDEVERYFRGVVDPFIDELGYRKAEMGETPAEEAFANLEIFRRIHHCALAVVDLSGVRPNCMMELGYAFGRLKSVVLTAIEGTDLPFDPSAIDTHFWNPSLDDKQRLGLLREYRARTAQRPALVKPRGWR